MTLAVAGVLFAPVAHAGSIPIGYVSFDVTGPGLAQFDINNETGVNSSPFPDETFPVTTSVSLSNLSLDIQYSSGPDLVFGPSSGYFTLSADGISWTGTALSTSVDQSSDGLLGSVDAILTGTFDTTSLNLNDGSSVSVLSSFSATINDPSGLSDGDLAVIYATTGSSGPPTTPEPETFVMVGTGLLAFANLRRRMILAGARKLFSRGVIGSALGLVALFLAMQLPALASPAVDSLKLNTWTNPSSGLAGYTEVTVTGSGFPSGSILPGSVTAAFATTCGGAAVATTNPGVVKTVIGTEDQLSEVLIPSTLSNGNYFVTVYGSSVGGTAFSSAITPSCSEITVTATSTTLAACVPTSSLAVVAGTNVNAYVPFGYWEGGSTGVEEVPLEGASVAQNFATSSPVNSCAANSTTGVVVCTENSAAVDVIKGSTITTLTSASNTFAYFTGGDCQNCGVGINAANNTAVIALGIVGGGAGPYGGESGVQVLNLSNNTFNTPVPMSHYVSEDISIDSGRNLILSPDESGVYDLLKIGPGNTLTEFGQSIGGTLDSAAEDCTTGIALSSYEFSDYLYITDLTQAVFISGTPGTWTGAGQFINLADGDYSAGTSGVSTAPGSNHLGVVTGEFGGSSYSALLLPSTSGSGTPTLADHAYVSAMPNTPDGYPFSAGLDPHTVTAYTSPNTSKSYAVFADYYLGFPSWLGIVDLQCVLTQPRSGVSVIGDAAACTRYVAVP
jgi:hypothetical protein